MGELCTACLCAGRNLFCIGDTGFYHLYSQILNEIQVYDASSFYLKVCWECVARLRRWHHFKEKAKHSYTQLHYVHQNNFIQPSPIPSTLQTSETYSFSCPELVIKAEADEGLSLTGPDIKTEEPHCEPETFVNNLEPRRRKGVKKDSKPIKDKIKTKKKIKPKPEVPPKKKVKLKKKRSPTPLSIEDDAVDSTHLLEDDLEDEGDVQTTEDGEKQVPFVEENTRLNGESKPQCPTETVPERPQCAECGKSFSSRKTYRYHLNVLHKGQNRYPCPRCGKVYQWKSNLGRHLRSHKARDSGELYCETCDKRFASVATYRQHLRVSRRHVPESDFSFMCNECGKKFVNKTRLRDHIDWEHLHNIKFRCQLCNKPFKCHTSLYVHMQNVHRNKEKKDNLCHVCGKSYQNAAKLKYHIVAMHTSETPYQCTQCSAAFGWYSSLYRHVREVHYKAGILITLRSGQLSVCSGTLVTTKKVLTAAQCWYDGYNVGRKAEVKLGLVELFNAFRWDVWRVRMHPAYDPTSLLNDLAIMILDGNTWPNNKMMIPAFLPDVNETNTYAGMEARVSGYGKTSDYDQINPETNQQALTVTVMRPWECYWNMARRPVDSSKIMCTPGSVLWGTCGADLGGPLVIPNFNGTGNHLLIGVTSIQSPFGCTSTFATGYTRVTEYVSWIKQNL